MCFGSQGPNRVYATTSTSSTASSSVFLGVTHERGEAVVDTAAEDGVIGLQSFENLKEILAEKGLQPIEVGESHFSCNGIGGEAKIMGTWDIPLGIAKINGVLRTTVLEADIPFLLPVSFLEVTQAVVDVGAEELRFGCGAITKMRRLPSGHRVVSVVEFGKHWSPPPVLRGPDGVDPFVIKKPDSTLKLRKGKNHQVSWAQESTQYFTIGENEEVSEGENSDLHECYELEWHEIDKISVRQEGEHEVDQFRVRVGASAGEVCDPAVVGSAMLQSLSPSSTNQHLQNPLSRHGSLAGTGSSPHGEGGDRRGSHKPQDEKKRSCTCGSEWCWRSSR